MPEVLCCVFPWYLYEVKPVSTVADQYILLISDLEKHTVSLQKWGDAFQTAINNMHERARQLAGACSGKYLKNLGDGFVIMFKVTESAVDCAIEIQRYLLQCESNAPFRLNLRIGIHSAHLEATADDYSGIDYALAARLTKAAHGSQILISEVAALQMSSESRLIRGITLVPLGNHFLKDFATPIGIYRVHSSLIRQNDLPPNSLKQEAHNLSPDTRRFVGRKAEIRTISKMRFTHPAWTGDGDHPIMRLIKSKNLRKKMNLNYTSTQFLGTIGKII